MIQESSEVLGGNDQFEGFVPDMVNILSRILHFNYTLRIGSSRDILSLGITVRQFNSLLCRWLHLALVSSS